MLLDVSKIARILNISRPQAYSFINFLKKSGKLEEIAKISKQAEELVQEKLSGLFSDYKDKKNRWKPYE